MTQYVSSTTQTDWSGELKLIVLLSPCTAKMKRKKILSSYRNSSQGTVSLHREICASPPITDLLPDESRWMISVPVATLICTKAGKMNDIPEVCLPLCYTMMNECSLNSFSSVYVAI